MTAKPAPREIYIKHDPRLPSLGKHIFKSLVGTTPKAVIVLADGGKVVGVGSTMEYGRLMLDHLPLGTVIDGMRVVGPWSVRTLFPFGTSFSVVEAGEHSWHGRRVLTYTETMAWAE